VKLGAASRSWLIWEAPYFRQATIWNFVGPHPLETPESTPSSEGTRWRSRKPDYFCVSQYSDPRRNLGQLLSAGNEFVTWEG